MRKSAVLVVAAVIAGLLGVPPLAPPSASAAALPPAAGAGVINGLIWRDANADGVNDASETGYSGVSVQLLDSTGTVVRSTTTDASGIYSFASLTGGPYTVRIPSTPTYFEVVGGGADQQLTQGPSPTVGVSAAVQPGTTVTCSPP